ncbi:MAG: UDP-N-acetylglucosamine 1-carboxyvinyltransferase [Planctomycetales bacterium]
MDLFVIRGGRPLAGRTRVGGAKNAALPIMAAALLADGPTRLVEVPHLVDVATLAKLLESLGMRVAREADGTMALEVVDERNCVAEYDLVRQMRATFCVLGPLLAKRGRACVSLPGGCNIGDRPIDLHLKGLVALGADVRVERGYVVAEARRLVGANVFLGGPFGSTVTGTCNVMMAAVLAEGVTTIEAAACEPEVVDLGRFLNALGARIDGLGTPVLRIEGVERLAGATHTVIPDRIEAATLMIAAAITRSRIELENVRLDHLTAVVEKLREMGVEVDSGQWTVDRLAGSPASGSVHCPLSTVHCAAVQPLQPVECTALPYPGVPTDVQAQLMALLTGAEGISVITDKVFPDRFLHAAELVRMGARIRREGPSAIISGVPRLSGASVMASDLRASAALVLAALAADGESVVRRIYHLDRGYERLEAKLNALGADVRRASDEPGNMPASLSAAVAQDLPAGYEAGHALRGPKWLAPAPGRTHRSAGRL